MARRGRTKKITYDSRETKAFVGFLFGFAGVLAILSLFLTGPIFSFIKDIFNSATVVLALFLISLSLNLFGKDLAFSNKRSILGQAFFLFFLAAFLEAIFGGGASSETANYGGKAGLAVYNFFNENVFLNFTPIFLFTGMLISLPIALSMTIVEFFEKIGAVGNALWQFVGKFSSNKAEVSRPEKVLEPMQSSPETFGGFRSPKPEPEKVTEQPSQQQQQHVSDIAKPPSNAPRVEIREESVEGAIVKTELQYPDWKLPTLDLLNPYKIEEPPRHNIEKNAEIIEQTLHSFNVKAKVVDVLIGPSVTQYALDIALGTKVSKIANLSNDLALALATPSGSLRIEAPIPGTSYVGIEIPNDKRSLVQSREVIERALKNVKYNLPIALGKNISGEYISFDLQKMPHVLIAGATGSGKSVLTNSFIISLLMKLSPDEVRFIMVDPKQVELSDYNGIPHLLTPVITEMDKVVNALKWAINEMETRYTIFKDAKVRNIEAYNEMLGFAAVPYIVIVIDEMADMMMSTNKVEVESAIVRLAQKARATGIHLVLATQRPSVDVITGLIKANVPARIGMSVTTQIDSRVIIDQVGSESLLGNGDLLFRDPKSGRPERIQGMWMAPDEIQRIVNSIKDQVPEVAYAKEIVEKQKDDSEEGGEGVELSSDNQFANAVRVIVNAQKGSASLLQRKLSIGYNRAARLLDELEEMGVVGAPNGAKPRDVLVTDAEGFLSSLGNNSENQ